MSTDIHTEAAEGFVCLVSHQQQQDTNTHISLPWKHHVCSICAIFLFCRFYILLQWNNKCFNQPFLSKQVCHWACSSLFFVFQFQALVPNRDFGECFIITVLQNAWIFLKLCRMCVNLRAESQIFEWVFMFVFFCCVNPTLTGAMTHVAGSAHLLRCNAFFLSWLHTTRHIPTPPPCVRQWCGVLF